MKSFSLFSIAETILVETSTYETALRMANKVKDCLLLADTAQLDEKRANHSGGGILSSQLLQQTVHISLGDLQYRYSTTKVCFLVRMWTETLEVNKEVQGTKTDGFSLHLDISVSSLMTLGHQMTCWCRDTVHRQKKTQACSSRPRVTRLTPACEEWLFVSPSRVYQMLTELFVTL